MKNNRNKRILIVALSIIVIIGVSVFFGFRAINKKLESFNHIDFSALDLSKVSDGTYTGSADGTIVKATVEVTVKDHVITNVTILKHESGKGQPAEVIVDDIVRQNSLEVDAISGATHSSNIIKAAVLDALTK